MNLCIRNSVHKKETDTKRAVREASLFLSLFFSHAQR
nr:MAG TPA: hypothetical protein [Caudoviricetes sp.]